MYEMFSCDSKRSSILTVVEMIPIKKPSKESFLALRHVEVRSGRTVGENSEKRSAVVWRQF